MGMFSPKMHLKKSKNYISKSTFFAAVVTLTSYQQQREKGLVFAIKVQEVHYYYFFFLFSSFSWQYNQNVDVDFYTIVLAVTKDQLSQLLGNALYNGKEMQMTSMILSLFLAFQTLFCQIFAIIKIILFSSVKLFEQF